MEQTEGIVTVIDQEDDQEDDALISLRALPKFEPLIVPEQTSHFSLASVFGSLSTSTDPKNSTPDMAFNPNILVDLLIQMNAHNKQCAEKIQEHQRSLAHKVKSLDSYTTGAVQGLTKVHQQAKNHSDQLLSVHAISKQAATTSVLLHGIIEKITLISNSLAGGVEVEPISEEKYPHLYRYLHQSPSRLGPKSTSRSNSEQVSSSIASSLALLGNISGPTARNSTLQKTGVLSGAKGRASMALAPSASSYLPLHGISEQKVNEDCEQASERQYTSRVVPQSKVVGTDQLQSIQSSTRASDNLRKLATKGL
ncbi:hypothetical protein BGZ76_009068 [Entomortierella beljakovae]|nr:hypothetical protein BGZ76_009068 [Entomortierella beljakovae]